MIEVSKHSTVQGLQRERAYTMYLESFEKLRATAIQRHVMTAEEFFFVMGDQRVVKYVGEDIGTGRLCALATLTNTLESMPLISPEFFAARWPEHYAQDRCYYIGFMAVHPDYQGTGVFVDIVGDVTSTVADAGGIAVLDVCTYNADRFRLPQVVARLANSTVPTAPELVDQQSYWAYQLDEAGTGRAPSVIRLPEQVYAP